MNAVLFRCGLTPIQFTVYIWPPEILLRQPGRLYGVCYIDLTTGFRREELLGLK